MKVEFIRFQASDGLELQGWLTEEESEVAALHIHGMSGNGYENVMLDSLRKIYSDLGISFFTVDTRGRGVVSGFKNGSGSIKGGSCYELFEESIHDIQGAIDLLKSKGKTRIILQGHSLGCTKVVNYLTSQDEAIEKVILLAPTDMVGWARTDKNHDTYTALARKYVESTEPTKLVSTDCWLDGTPISAQTYLSVCQPETSADIYGDRPGGSLISRISQPMLIPYGTDDIGITEIDGNMDKFIERVQPSLGEDAEVSVIDGADHGFTGLGDELANRIRDFLTLDNS